MNFTTVSFVFFLLPITILYYFAVGPVERTKYRNWVLFIASLIFYGWCGIQYLILLMVMIFANYGVVATLLKKKNRNLLGLAIILNVAILSFFKYTTFFMKTMNDVLQVVGIENISLPEPKIPLPLGISFFVFQIIALLVDAYQGKFDKISLFDMALFITFFPQLIQGPILRYNDISLQIQKREQSIEGIESGIKRFIQGFGKKILIADNLSVVSNQIFDLCDAGIGNLYAWLGIVSYAFVIYYDFSGYSDMAVGLCKIFGFTIPENFNYPYTSKSIQEFWRRWHISLSSWFRDYVYIPLGGNRVGVWRTYRNLLVVFLLTGIWHGAQWTFIVWGLFHGLFMLLERIGLKNLLNKAPAFLSRAYCILVVLVGWVFFRAENMRHAAIYLKCMFWPNNFGIQNLEILQNLDLKFVAVFVCACCFCSPSIRDWIDKLESGKLEKIIKCIYLVVFVMAISAMMGASFSPSIYEKF